MSSSNNKNIFGQAICSLCALFKPIEKTLSKRIHEAYTEYDYGKLSTLIKALKTPDALNEAGETPLYLASIKGTSSKRDREMVKFLLEKGANVLHYSYNGEKTPAAYIVEYEDQDLIDKLLHMIGDVNSPLDKSENTALHLAVIKARKTTVIKLLKKGANPNKKNSHRRAAMHDAVTTEGCNLLKILEEYGGNINLGGNLNYSPLHLATLLEVASTSEHCSFGDSTEMDRIMDEVLKLNPYMNVRDSTSNTPLGTYLFYSEKVRKNIMLKYINGGADLSLQDQSGMNALQRLVVRNKCSEPENLVEILISSGIDINAGTYFCGDTALHIAATFGYTEYTHILLSMNANPFIRNFRGRTPMDLAIFFKQTEVIEIIYSFIIRLNLPVDGLMMEYHQTKPFYQKVMDIYERTLSEYEWCKRTMINPPRQIYYSDLFVMSERQFSKLLKNKVISDIINGNLIDFQAFRRSLNKLYHAAKRRREAEDAAVSFLYEAWNGKLPVSCLEIIVEFMKTEELMSYVHI